MRAAPFPGPEKPTALNALPLEIAATLFAGLGLFFVGLRFISKNLANVVGPRTRLLLSKSLAGRGSTLAFGALAGAVMQSVNAVTMLLVALVSVGAIEVRRAFPIIGWANIGTSAIVLVAALNIRLLVLLILGVVGIAYYFNLDQATRYKHAVGALLGVGMLFLGVDFIKGVGAPIQELEYATLGTAMGGSLDLLAFAIGVLVTLASQSSTTVTIVAMALATSGVISMENGALVVVGSGLGSALSALLLAFRMHGTAKQLMIYQALLKASGVAVLLVLTGVNVATDGVLLSAVQAAAGGSASLALAFVYILLQLSSDLVMHLAHRPMNRLVERLAPLTSEELLSQPEHLSDSALEEPEVALLLVEREQQRLIERLPHYLDSLRADAPPSSVGALPQADSRIAHRCEQFLRHIVERHPSQQALDRAILLRDRNALITSLQETLAELAEAGSQPGGNTLASLRASVVESLHMLLQTLCDVVDRRDPDDIGLFLSLTQDRSDMMEAIRRRPASEMALDGQAQHALIAMTSLFERAVWLLRRHALLADRLDGTTR